VTNHPEKRRDQIHVIVFFKFCPNNIFVIGEARHFKFRVLIDIEEYECMHYSQKECVRRHVNSIFKFREISDNISETVLDRDIVAMED